jgi:hypothetical protein
MSQQFPPGWVDAIAQGVKSGDEKTRAEALGVQPRRCFRLSNEAYKRSRQRGSQRGYQTRYGLRNLPPIEEDE